MKRTIGVFLDDASRRIGTPPLTAKAHAKALLSNTTVSGLPLRFRKLSSVSKLASVLWPLLYQHKQIFHSLLPTKIAFGVLKILIDRRR
jgi:hypothetical protein